MATAFFREELKAAEEEAERATARRDSYIADHALTLPEDLPDPAEVEQLIARELPGRAFRTKITQATADATSAPRSPAVARAGSPSGSPAPPSPGPVPR